MIKHREAQLVHDNSDVLTFSGGGKKAPSLSEENHHGVIIEQ